MHRTPDWIPSVITSPPGFVLRQYSPSFDFIHDEVVIAWAVAVDKSAPADAMPVMQPTAVGRHGTVELKDPSDGQDGMVMIDPLGQVHTCDDQVFNDWETFKRAEPAIVG